MRARVGRAPGQVTTKAQALIARKLQAAEATLLTPLQARMGDACIVSATGQLLYATWTGRGGRGERGGHG